LFIPDFYSCFSIVPTLSLIIISSFLISIKNNLLYSRILYDLKAQNRFGNPNHAISPPTRITIIQVAYY